MKKKDSVKTICLISEASFDPFQSEIVEGVMQAIREKNALLLRCAVESEQFSACYRLQFEEIFDLLERHNPDGVLFLGWMKSVVRDPDGFLAALHRGARCPVVSVGSITAGVPSFCMDGARYMHELLSHLVDIHGYRRIAFIEPYTPDDRCPTYERFMRERGLFDPQLVIRRDELMVGEDFYGHKRAARVCQVLFDERTTTVDAVMSLYTYESAFLLRECRERGIRVPEDLAVTGWEDGDLSKYSDPPITSVYFPFYEIGLAASQGLFRLIEGGALPPSHRYRPV
ncbi:MAG TPA: LacI family transcriptional regulator [Spirochaetia bacterium]|nr:LacI family transcriptional regulator [Spirochaetia bacterium]